MGVIDEAELDARYRELVIPEDRVLAATKLVSVEGSQNNYGAYTRKEREESWLFRRAEEEEDVVLVPDHKDMEDRLDVVIAGPDHKDGDKFLYLKDE